MCESRLYPRRVAGRSPCLSGIASGSPSWTSSALISCSATARNSVALSRCASLAGLASTWRMNPAPACVLSRFKRAIARSWSYSAARTSL